ncbi:MAG TPA: Na+/H+ antiporter subunit E [Aggregatilineales bacterium]|nr:Na+/H+ antiporter subunit E [Aggregatilineales bacterium]
MKKLFAYLILAIPFGLIWVILTNVTSLESYLLGYVLGLIVVLLGVRVDTDVNLATFPKQAWTFIRYSVFMVWQIALATWDVNLRVFGFRPVRAGIIAVPIEDETGDELIAGASAHSITITPGEVVVDYDKECKIMYVHCIDVEQSGKSLQPAQATRLAYFKRILNK